MFIYLIASSKVLDASRSPKFQATIDHATITIPYIRILKRNTVILIQFVSAKDRKSNVCSENRQMIL